MDHGIQARRAVVCAVGSGGDVLPFIRIARAIAARGVQTTVLAPQRYRVYADRANVEFQSIGADDVFSEVFDGDAVWHPIKGLAASWRYYGAAMRSGLTLLRSRWRASDTVLVGSSFAMATRLAEELEGFRNLTVHLSPSLLWSAVCPPRWPTGGVPHGWPLVARRLAMTLAEKAVLDPVITAHVNPYRLELGLPPVRRIFSQRLHGRRLAYAFPEWFAPAASDWPAQGRFAGFVLPEVQHVELEPALARFVGGNKPVVVVTAGTAVARRPLWASHACAAALDHGCRVVIVSSDQSVPAQRDVLAVGYAPFEALLAHARVFVHHGGIGSIAEAMRAGVAQVIVPSAHDQPDNAWRVERIGNAVVVKPNAAAAAFRGAVRCCLTSSEIAHAVDVTRHRMAEQDNAAEYIAHLAISERAGPIAARSL